ncbi:MAG TPA: 5-dehydro-4-deoxy-D-glucuronate isomerase [Bacillales bacterium]
MEIRHAMNPNQVKNFSTNELRENFLVEALFTQGEINMLYTHHDRMVVGGAVPDFTPLEINDHGTFKTNYFLERREIGIVNIGSAGRVIVDGETYNLDKRDCLYVGMGNEKIELESVDPSSPARFYLISSPAHKSYPIKKIGIDEATPAHLGNAKESNKRTIYKYIHADGIQSCQLMMGMTLLEDNSLWNTMPAHLHDRRSEIYLYFDLDENSRVCHFMGEPEETKHLFVKNEEVVISPSWSIHSGVGMSSYTFIWAMAGENYTFDDMDPVEISQLR